MKFQISSQELNYLLSKINVIPLKPSVPVLANILIEAHPDQLVISGGDLNVSIRCYADADVSTLKILETGSTALPGRKLIQLARELSAPKVEVSTSASEITTILSGTSRFKLNGLGAAHYPTLPDLKEAFTLKLLQSQLKELIYSTSFAVSRESHNYVLTGLCLQIANGRISLIGTDGKKLAHASAALPIDVSFTGQAVIPLKAVDEIAKNLTEQGEVTIFLMADKIGVEANQTKIIAKLLAGEYPDVQRVIPENTPIQVSLHREELSALLRQISLFTADNHYLVRCLFGSGELQLTAHTAEVGEANVSMPVNYVGPPLEIAFNPAFFLDILRHCKQETVTLGLTDRYNPGLVKDGAASDNFKDAQSLFVIMPLRLLEA